MSSGNKKKDYGSASESTPPVFQSSFPAPSDAVDAAWGEDEEAAFDRPTVLPGEPYAAFAARSNRSSVGSDSGEHGSEANLPPSGVQQTSTPDESYSPRSLHGSGPQVEAIDFDMWGDAPPPRDELPTVPHDAEPFARKAKRFDSLEVDLSAPEADEHGSQRRIPTVPGHRGRRSTAAFESPFGPSAEPTPAQPFSADFAEDPTVAGNEIGQLRARFASPLQDAGPTSSQRRPAGINVPGPSEPPLPIIGGAAEVDRPPSTQDYPPPPPIPGPPRTPRGRPGIPPRQQAAFEKQTPPAHAPRGALPRPGAMRSPAALKPRDPSVPPALGGPLATPKRPEEPTTLDPIVPTKNFRDPHGMDELIPLEDEFDGLPVAGQEEDLFTDEGTQPGLSPAATAFDAERSQELEFLGDQGLPEHEPSVGQAPPAAADPGDDAALQDMRDRYAAGDFSGALVVAESILETEPTNAEVVQFAESCREVLRQMYAARLGSVSKVPRVIVPPDQIRWLSLDHRAGFVLSCVDGISSVEDILDVSGMQSLDALRILFELLQQRIIAVE